MALNEEQAIAAKELQEFLEGPSGYFVLTGPAGSGKTYLLNHVLPDQAIITATTNKAASVLRGHFSQVQTIHSLLGLVIQNNYTNGKTDLVRTKKSIPIHKQVVVIDEASMIDQQLFDLIDELLVDCHVIFVGDAQQLLSPSSKKFSVFHLDFPTAQLFRIMRSDGVPELGVAAQYLRGCVMNGTNGTLSNNPAIRWVDSRQLLDLYRWLKDRNELQESILLSFTNQRAIAACASIRGVMGHAAEFSVGDRVIINQACKNDDDMLVPTDTLTRITGMDVGREETIFGTDCGVFVGFNDTGRREYLLKQYANDKNWDAYFAVKDKYVDLRHAEALTIHKSQGSSFDTVIVDMASLERCKVPDDRRRLMYVACSRARKNLYLLA